MDQFAQTREQDNLFDDDFTPIITVPKTQQVVPQNHQSQLRQQKRYSSSAPKSASKVSESIGDPKTTNHQSQRRQQKHSSSAPKSATKESEFVGEPTATSYDYKARYSAAVRGDRSATGGINKPKLTETELSARLEAAKLNNARREEAHRLAEADEASFQKREAQASQKRKEEGVAKRAMEAEREKNRLRKLGARAGREWDEGKEDEHIGSRTESRYRRGVHGGIAYTDESQQHKNGDDAPRDQDYTGREYFGQRGARGRGERSRGERGRGGRGGRGRGGGGYEGGRVPQNNPSSSTRTIAPNLATETDFPSLPTTAAKPKSPESKSPPSSKELHPSSSSSKQKNGTDFDLASSWPIVEKQSWADESANEAIQW